MIGSQPVYGGFAYIFIITVVPGANKFRDVLNYTRFRPNQITGQTEKKTFVTIESEQVVVLVQDVLDYWIEPFFLVILKPIWHEATGDYFGESVSVVVKRDSLEDILLVVPQPN